MKAYVEAALEDPEGILLGYSQISDALGKRVFMTPEHFALYLYAAYRVYDAAVSIADGVVILRVRESALDLVIDAVSFDMYESGDISFPDIVIGKLDGPKKKNEVPAAFYSCLSE